VPASALRKGVNVLAVELVRAPYPKIVEEQKAPPKGRDPDPIYDLSWNTCEIRHVRLTAAGAEGLVPNAVRPAGLQVWNSDAMATDFDLDFGDAGGGPGPIRIVGAKNGSFAGKVVVGSGKAVQIDALPANP
jgi:hypothetical protein